MGEILGTHRWVQRFTPEFIEAAKPGLARTM
jgi:hypothetical protein